MERVRRTAVAGTWYPGDAARLAREVSRYLAAADVDAPPDSVRALIAPHAGLMYSGPVAAFAYTLARAAAIRTVVLVGPSHFVPFVGVSIWPTGSWDTPMGPLRIDAELAAAIAAAGDPIVDLPAAHGREHSLEMQLPFLAHLLPGAAIVPLVIGHQTRATAFALGDAIARAVAPRRDEVLLVASSDLSHYEEASVAETLDAVVAGCVEAMDPDALMRALEREPRHACGGGAMVAVIHAARQLGCRAARVLEYADSGDVSGDKTSVVGYLAAAIW